MRDLISRQAAIDAVKDAIISAEQPYAEDALRKLPSAEPERKIICCKDCKFAHLTTKGEVKYCDVWFPETKTYLSADDFCSSAEKRGE